MECCVGSLSNQFPTALLVLAGDFNAFDNDDIVSTCAFNCIVDQPTRGVNCLDKIFVSELCYANVKVVTSAVRSDHKAVIAYNGPRLPAVNKQRHRRAFRSRSPDEHAQFLRHITQLKLDFDEDADVQTCFSSLYHILLHLLDQFYPEQQIAVTSTDPQFVTPAIKSMLRRKYRLMRAGIEMRRPAPCRLEYGPASCGRIQCGCVERTACR